MTMAEILQLLFQVLVGRGLSRMKRPPAPAWLVAGLLCAGCGAPHSASRRHTTFQATLVQIAPARFALRLTETVRHSDYVRAPRFTWAGGTDKTFQYPEVQAGTDGQTRTAHVRTPAGEIVASASLTIRTEADGLFADYEVRKTTPGGSHVATRDRLRIR